MAFEAEAQVCGQPDPRVATGRLGDAISRTCVRPGGAVATVVENGLAVEAELNRAVDTTDGAEEDVLGLVVRGGPPVAVAARLGCVPGAYQEGVQHLDPAAPGPPDGLEHQCAREIATALRHQHVRRTQPETSSSQP